MPGVEEETVDDGGKEAVAGEGRVAGGEASAGGGGGGGGGGDNEQPRDPKRKKDGTNSNGSSTTGPQEEGGTDGLDGANGPPVSMSLDAFALGAATKPKSKGSGGGGGGSSGRRDVVAVDPTEGGARAKAKRVNRADNKMVRTDATTLRLDSFLRPLPTANDGGAGDGLGGDMDADGGLAGSKRRFSDGQNVNGEGASSSASSSSSSGTMPAVSLAGGSEGADCGECGTPAAPVNMNMVGAFAKPMKCDCKTRAPSNEAVAAAIAAKAAEQPRKRLRPLVDTACTYDSIQGLIAEIKSSGHKTMATMLKKHVWVGLVDPQLSLIQWNTKLMLLNHKDLARELFFQLAVRRFGCMGRLELSSPMPLRAALLTALDLESTNWTPEDGPKEEIAAEAEALLVSKNELLDEYFKIGIGMMPTDSSPSSSSSSSSSSPSSESAALTSLPQLLDGHSPEPSAIPSMLLRLASEVDWEDEQPCFETISAELANAYCVLPQDPDAEDFSDESADADPANPDPAEPVYPPAAEVVQHTLYPAFRHYLVPPRDFAGDSTVMQVACLEKLFKIFERC